MKKPSALVETGIGLWSRGLTLIYTVLMRSRFRSWGQHSRLRPPATLDSPWLIDVGSQVVIREHAWLNANGGRSDDRASLIIGDGTYIGRFSHINARQDVVIEPGVLIADRVFVSDEEHLYEDPIRPISLQGNHYKGPVLLRCGCWIGAGAAIMPGVTVGRNAIVATNAVVTHNVPDYAVVGGVPARLIKMIAQD